jgi:hypothetical protein
LPWIDLSTPFEIIDLNALAKAILVVEDQRQEKEKLKSFLMCRRCLHALSLFIVEPDPTTGTDNSDSSNGRNG